MTAVTAVTARPAAATVLRATSTTGRPPGRSPPAGAAAWITPMSQAGASSAASVEVPAPPCAPATTISGSGGRRGGTRRRAGAGPSSDARAASLAVRVRPARPAADARRHVAFTRIITLN